MFSEDYHDRPITPDDAEPDLLVCDFCEVSYTPNESDAENWEHWCSAECESADAEEE